MYYRFKQKQSAPQPPHTLERPSGLIGGTLLAQTRIALKVGVLLVVPLMAGAILSGCTDKEAAGVLPQIGLVEMLRLGDESAGDTVLFGWIDGFVTVDGAGRIFVGETQEAKIYVFSATGELLTVVGQPGEGPGEFKQFGRYMRAGLGDSLYVYDFSQERVSVFEPESFALAYVVRVPRDVQYSPNRFIGVANAGFVFNYLLPFWGRSGEEMEVETRVVVVDRQGRIKGTPLITLPALEEFIATGPSGASSLSVPFGRAPFVRMGPGQSVYTGWNESLDIAIIDATGLTRGSISLEHEPVSVTAADIDKWLEGRGSFIRDAVLQSDRHDTKPAYDDFLVDDLGQVWFKTTRSAVTAATEWLLVDTDSRVRGTLTAPPGIRLQAIRGGRVYAVDRTGSHAVVVYKLED